MNRHILFIVENNSVPEDVRVWREALAAKEFGNDVSIICPVRNGRQKRKEILEGITIYRHPYPIEAGKKYDFIIEYLNALIWELLYALRIHLNKPFDAIHAANPPDHIFIIALFFKLFGAKFIFDHHDVCPENYIAKFGKKDVFYRVMNLMEKLTFKTADIVISTNHSYKKVAIQRGRKKEEDVYVVRNGPDLNRITFPKANSKWKNGRKYLVAYLGTIGNQEGLDVLVKAVQHIIFDMKITDIQFIVMGTGTYLDELRLMADNLNVSSHINFTGYIPYEDLYEVLSTADVCVNPEFRNPFTDKSTMIKIMDYMSFGCPIVQFETTEGRVTAGESAIYIEENSEIKFAETIVKLLQNKEKRQKMGKVAIDRIIKTLNWDVQKIQMKKAYKALFARIY